MKFGGALLWAGLFLGGTAWAGTSQGIVSVPVLPPPIPAAADHPTPGTALSLPHALHLALEHNPDILSTQSLIAQAEAQLHLVEITWYPTATADLAVQVGSLGVTAGGFGAAEQSTTGDVAIHQTVSDFGRTRAAVAAALATLQGTRADLLTKQEDVALLVEQQYFTAIANAQLAAIAADSVKDEQKHLDQAQGFFEEGTKARIDVAQAQASVAQARLSLVQAVNARQQAYLALNNAMGIRTTAAYQLDDSLILGLAQAPPTSDPAATPDPQPLIDEAYRRRPEMLKLEAQIQSAQASLELARLGLSPTLSTNGDVTPLNLTGQNTPSWSVGMTMSIPLLDAHSTRYQTELALATLQTLRAQQISLENTVFQQVQQDALNLQESTTSVQEARSGVDSAAEAFRLADGRYQAGLGSSLDFLDAQVANSQARSALVSAEVSVRVAQSQMNRDVGRTEFLQEVGSL